MRDRTFLEDKDFKTPKQLTPEKDEFNRGESLSPRNQNPILLTRETNFKNQRQQLIEFCQFEIDPNEIMTARSRNIQLIWRT